MCFTKPVQDASSPVSSSTRNKIRRVEEGWTPRGPGIWTDEEFDSSDDVYFVQAPIKPVQKKPFHIIRKERAEYSLKRAETSEKTPFIVQKRRSITTPKTEIQEIKIVQKKRIVQQATPAIVRKVRSIVYSRTTLVNFRSVGVNVGLSLNNFPEDILEPESNMRSKAQDASMEKPPLPRNITGIARA